MELIELLDDNNTLEISETPTTIELGEADEISLSVAAAVESEVIEVVASGVIYENGGGGGGTITSVNGYTSSVIVLTAADVDALPDTYVPSWASITGKPSTYPPDAHLHTGVYEPAIDAGTNSQYLRGDKSWQTLDKAAVGLSAVDNTSDAGKPVSSATQTALNLKANLASPTFTGTVSGITAAMVGAAQTSHTHTSSAITDFTSAVQSIVNTQLDIAGAPGTLDTLNELAAALGDDPNFATTVTNSIALKAPLASPTFTGTVSGITKAMVGLGNVDNTADTAKPVSTAQATAIALKADAANPAFTGTTVSLADGLNFVGNTVTGNKIGTATAQKLGFFGVTPVAQQNATADLGTVLSALGLRATGTAYPITTSGSTSLTGGLTSSGQSQLTGPLRLGSNTLTSSTTPSITAGVSQYMVDASAGPVTITLPTTASSGWRLLVKKVDTSSNTVTVSSNGGSIDGAATVVLNNPWEYVDVVSTFTSLTWRIVGIQKASTHVHTAADVGLANVNNTSDADKPVSTATQNALNLKANLASPTFTGTVSGITSAMVGLGNVDNTADTAKPVSSAQQTALNLKANLASPTFTGTVSGITAAMVGAAPTVHGHALTDANITGVLPIAQIPTGTTSTTVALGNHLHTGVYAPVSHTHAAADITSGTIATARLGSGTADSTTYLRGDGTWATVSAGASGSAYGNGLIQSADASTARNYLEIGNFVKANTSGVELIVSETDPGTLTTGQVWIAPSDKVLTKPTTPTAKKVITITPSGTQSVESFVPTARRIPGFWHMPQNLTSTGASSPIADRATFIPITLRAGTYNGFAVRKSAAQVGGTTTMTIGVYPSNDQGYPKTLGGPIAQGNVDLTGAGSTPATVDVTEFTIPEDGEYFMCTLYRSIAAPTTVPTLVCVSGQPAYSLPWTTMDSSQARQAYTRTGVTALPTDETTLANLGMTGANNAPSASIRASAT